MTHLELPRTPRRLAGFLALAFMLAMTSGCAFTRGDYGMPFADAELAGIKQGQSTAADVVKALGAPDNIIRLNGGREAFQYYHYALKHATLIVFSRVNIASDELYVFLDPQGVVDQVIYGKRTDKLEFQFWPFGA